MPIDYSLEREGTLVIAKANGALTLDCFIALQKELNADDGLKTPHNTLLDVRLISKIQLTEQDLTTIANNLTEGQKTLGANKLAIVARERFAFELGNLYGTIEKEVNENVIVFSSLAVANVWLGID